MLILIKSDRDTIFGAYVDTIFQLKGGNKYLGSNDSFVFQLKPEEKVFYSTKKNEYHLICTTEYFSLGAGG